MMICECEWSTSKIKWEQNSVYRTSCLLLNVINIQYHFAFEFILCNLQARQRLTERERDCLNLKTLIKMHFVIQVWTFFACIVNAWGFGQLCERGFILRLILKHNFSFWFCGPWLCQWFDKLLVWRNHDHHHPPVPICMCATLQLFNFKCSVSNSAHAVDCGRRHDITLSIS